MTSYQANFASHPTPDRHVGFLLHGRVYQDTTKCLVAFYLLHITMPNYDRVSIIPKHSVEMSNLAIKWIKSNSRFCCFSPYRAIQKGNQGAGGKSCAYRCVPRRANPLLSTLRLRTNAARETRCTRARLRTIVSNYRGFSRRGTHPVRAPSRAPCWIFWNNKICFNFVSILLEEIKLTVSERTYIIVPMV